MGMLFFALKTFSEIYITDEKAEIKHPGGSNGLILSEVSFAEKSRMFGNKSNLG